WRTGASEGVRGETLELTFDPPVDTDHINVHQLLTGYQNRTITDLDLRFDGGDVVHTTLDGSSRTEAGQVISFDRRTFHTLDLIIRGDDTGLVAQPGRPVRYKGYTEVGFSEVDVAGRTANEVLRLPDDLLGTLGVASQPRPLTVLLERERTDPAESVREDEETHIAR